MLDIVACSTSRFKRIIRKNVVTEINEIFTQFGILKDLFN